MESSRMRFAPVTVRLRQCLRCEARWYHGNSSVLRDGAAFVYFGAEGGDHVTYGEQVLSRLNIPSVLLMALGAVLMFAEIIHRRDQ